MTNRLLVVVRHSAIFNYSTYSVTRLAPSRFSFRLYSISNDNNGLVVTQKASYIVERHYPQPVRREFITRKAPWSSRELETLDIGIGQHRIPSGVSDYVAYKTVRFLRFFADAFFRKRYVHRAIVLETVAAVPGMVAAMLRHLTSLRKMAHDGGWISHLLHEAENERMHLLTWMKVTQPSFMERALVATIQGVFFNIYFIAYLFFPRTAHRMVGYLEEEAVVSYTGFLEAIDAGLIDNTAAPKIAIDYWRLNDDAKLRDVVLAVRADEAAHRDVNHHLADRLHLKVTDLTQQLPAGSDGKTEIRPQAHGLTMAAHRNKDIPTPPQPQP